MKEDGNLVLVFVNQSRVLWQSSTGGRGKRLEMKLNGNLIIYDKSNQIVWESNTTGRGDSMQIADFGNLVVYDLYKIRIWSTKTELSILPIYIYIQ